MRKVYYNSILAHLFLWVKGKSTATFFGFICTKRKKTDPLSLEAINHEAIHAEQYMEITAAALLLTLALSPIFGWAAWPFILALTLFYVIYFVEAGISWAWHSIRRQKAGTAPMDQAYYNSMFEMEAYANEEKTGYISARKPFHWLHYIGKV